MSTTNEVFNPLFIFGNAYGHPVVEDLVKKISDHYDVLEFCRVPEEDMLRMAINFFKKVKKYTHFSYIAPDLHVHLADIERLEKDIYQFNPEVISACCNVDHGNSSHQIACCYRPPSYEFQTRRYRWLAESQRLASINKGYAIEQFGFSGMALCMIRRDILYQIDLWQSAYPTEAKSRWDDRFYGYSWDLNFSKWCNAMGITNLVDLRVKLKHDRDEYRSLVGEKSPYIVYSSRETNIILKSHPDTETTWEKTRMLPAWVER